MKKPKIRYFLWTKDCVWLGPQDVPPGSYIGKLDGNGDISMWYPVLTVTMYGAVIAGSKEESGSGQMTSGYVQTKPWERLGNHGWLIKRPGRPWEPCYKKPQRVKPKQTTCQP